MEVAAGHRITDALHALAFKSNKGPTCATFRPPRRLVLTNYVRFNYFRDAFRDFYSIYDTSPLVTSVDKRRRTNLAVIYGTPLAAYCTVNIQGTDTIS